MKNKESRRVRVRLLVLNAVILFLGMNSLFTEALAQPLTCQFALSSYKKITPKNADKMFQYFEFQGKTLPYLDLRQKGAFKGTVVLVSGFSRNSKSWLSQIESFRKKGHRVIAFDQSNVGHNLLENGILHFGFGEGLPYDASAGHALINKLKPQKLSVVGYSRGGWVASKIVDLFKRSKTVKVKKLVLVSPYVEYLWNSGVPGLAGMYFNSAFHWTLAFNPGFVGRSMGASLKQSEYEAVEGVSNELRDRALGYILKGTNPGSNEQKPTTKFLKSAVKSGVRVRVVTGENDPDLAPLEVVGKLDIKGVDFNVLEGDEYTHYWPETHPKLFVEKVLED